MLILTRRTGETIRVGDDIAITVLGVKGNQVRIGVAAPKDVTVHREEIWNRVQEEQREYTHTRQPGDPEPRFESARPGKGVKHDRP